MEQQSPLLKNNSRFKTNPLDVEHASAAVSAFRRRNKILILVLLFLILLLCIVVSVLIAYFLHNFGTDRFVLQPLRPRPIVISALHSSDFNATQVLVDSLQTAADKLHRFVSLLSGVGPGGNFVIACSNSSAEALSQIAGALERMESRSDDRRMEIVDRMKAAAASLESCVGALQRAEATATATVREAATAVSEVLDCLDDGVWKVGTVLEESGDDAVLEESKYGVVFGINYGIDWRGMAYENLFGIGMVAFQLIYMFFLFWCLFRIP